MTEYAVMPLSDYVNYCDKIREKTDTTENIKSGEMPEKINEVYEVGYEQGIKAEYDAFWDEFQNFGNRTNYWYGFSGLGWTPETLNPKYPIKIVDTTQNAQYAVGMFYRANALTGVNKAKYIDFSLLADKFDFSQVQRATSLFDSAKFKNVIADLSSAVYANSAFAGTWNPGVVSVTLKVSELLQNVGSMFGSNLERITMMEGSVWAVSISFSGCTKLDKSSHISIINTLSTTTSGLTVTFSKTAVNNAFETSEGANDGATSEEWLNLIATKPNWTFALV